MRSAIENRTKPVWIHKCRKIKSVEKKCEKHTIHDIEKLKNIIYIDISECGE